MPASFSCPSCGCVFDPGVTRICPQCATAIGPNWRPWIGPLRVLGVVGFLLVVDAPWQITLSAAGLVAVYSLLRPPKVPPTRQEIEQQERNARSPNLLRIANFGVGLSGALLFTSFLGSFVMFMNARENVQQESAGTYHMTSFRVLQSYWQKGTTTSIRMGSMSSPTRAFARGLVEGKEEWMDLIPYLTFIPKDQETVSRLVPAGTVLPVYYNPQLQGEYRVRLLRPALPAEANRRAEWLALKYGAAALLTTSLMLFGFLRLRRFALASA